METKMQARWFCLKAKLEILQYLCVLHIYDRFFILWTYGFILHNNIRTVCFMKLNSIRRFQKSLAMSSLSKAR